MESIYCKKLHAAEQLLLAASALLLCSEYKTSVFFRKYPHIFFDLKSFLWNVPLTVKIRKKIIDQILGYISFCFEFCAITPRIIKCNRPSCSKNEPNTKLNHIFIG